MRSPLLRTAALLLAAAALTAPAAATAAPRGPGHGRAPGPAGEAECHTRVQGSHATADCFNGNATPDHVQLHVQCARWWDPAMDSAPAVVGPARHVALAQRCWLEIRNAWVTHDHG
ncbi:hypothetical protein FHS39_002099 [Streptomyces olivoverticillatus]|uniref:Secreted protein n=1 Tax=Streptomyces olivoverticillatus TaxID=66427 RepID=A0A7W7PL56_9ACTN|nr:hypothetical protein [Streptomyces olivoverticillatus]MBB4893088.1 hypothetical protein [Streptomyces olivoverticillatus]